MLLKLSNAYGMNLIQMKILTQCVCDGARAPAFLMSSWTMWVPLVYGLQFGQQGSVGRLCVWNICMGLILVETKSFAQVDSETHMPLRTRWYLCSLYNSGFVRGGPKTYEHLSLKIFKVEREGELGTVSR